MKPDLFKKVAIADACAPFVDNVFGGNEAGETVGVDGDNVFPQVGQQRSRKFGSKQEKHEHRLPSTGSAKSQMKKKSRERDRADDGAKLFKKMVASWVSLLYEEETN